ncbi:hypothetical protein [Actinoallomurus acanthiterrae]
MRRALTYVAAWGGATSLAVLLVWFGARPVLHNAVFGPPPARSVVDHVPESPATSTAPPSPAEPSPTVRATPKRTVRPTPSRSSTKASPSSHADTRSYTLDGGQVVLSMGATSARLVSATPAAGWEVRTWHAPGWLRVDFTKGETTSSLFCTWNGHPPAVQVENQ